MTVEQQIKAAGLDVIEMMAKALNAPPGSKARLAFAEQAHERFTRMAELMVDQAG